MPDDAPLPRLARAVADGSRIDWEAGLILGLTHGEPGDQPVDPQRSPSWVNSASSMSKRSSPLPGRYPLAGTNWMRASAQVRLQGREERARGPVFGGAEELGGAQTEFLMALAPRR
jgi:hypothetical protein